MTEAIIHANRNLKCECCDRNKLDKILIQQDGENIDEAASPKFENMTIVLEISKFFGKDLNVVVTYDIFKKICMKNVRLGYNGEKIKGY